MPESSELRPNETRALAALFRAGASSRAALARDLGLTRSTTGILVQSLAEAGLARERSDTAIAEQDGEGRVGRPGILVEIDGDGAFFLGAYIGVNWIIVVAIDLAGKVRGRASRPFAGAGSAPEDAVTIVAALVDEVIAQLPRDARLSGLNVAVPGFLDADGTTYHAVILGWHRINLATLFARVLGPDMPVLLENDANAVALAETYRRRPDDQASGDSLVVLIENGVGGGFISGGRLHRGHLRGAGEIGHMPLGDEGFIHDAQRPGRFETYVGKDALLARHAYIGRRAVTFDMFLAALAAGESAAVKAAGDWGRWLARGLAALICTLQPERVILAGSGNEVYPFVATQVKAFLSTYLVEGYPVPSIELSQSGPDGPAIGAAFLLHQAALSADPPFQLRNAAAR
ncbi:ROK family transcriptional regulator [Taklimakanibacter lacteus]|uniref:ROK family transcriptional regulator n=1 Tax=Taklimakanibacter lacteus TaxID=2268456 RepID=UPI000E6602FB